MATSVLPEQGAQAQTSSASEPLPSTAAEQAQILWAATPISARLKVLRGARHELARLAPDLARAISPDLSRTPADTLVAEVLPLLAACKFLEQRAASLLAPRRLGRRGRPFWLAGVESEVHRVPLGHVLIIGPSNYPLFLPGVQALQALAAGNAVTWKPGRGGQPAAQLFADALHSAGLPSGLLRITGESIAAVTDALAERPAKVFFTGSADTGRTLMRQLAETLTPSVMELSGCDAVIVLPTAGLSRVVAALTFGMRLNGSATCMAPRRVLLADATPARREAFLAELAVAFSHVQPITVQPHTAALLRDLLSEAAAHGAHIDGDYSTPDLRPLLVTGVRPEMRLAQTDIFAPIVSVIEVAGKTGILAAQEACPFALTASIFGDEGHARALAAKIVAGTVVINDIIVPTADPRLPIGGRRGSGFGVTRGAEGLLEMTAVKSIAVRKNNSTRHYDPTGTPHESLFGGIIAASHSESWTARWRGLRQVVQAGKKLAQKH